jgi:hypothetical protein
MLDWGSWILEARLSGSRLPSAVLHFRYTPLNIVHSANRLSRAIERSDSHSFTRTIV